MTVAFARWCVCWRGRLLHFRVASSAALATPLQARPPARADMLCSICTGTACAVRQGQLCKTAYLV